MRILGNLMHHLQRVLQMAKATQTDLVKAYATGELSQLQWAEMVQTCRGCAWSGQCQGWLARNEAVATAPKNCLNRDRFARLKSRLR